MNCYPSRCLFLAGTLLMVGTLSADRLVFRDGREIEGRLISVQDGVVQFQEIRGLFSSRVLRLDRRDILGVEFDRDSGFYDDTRNDPPPAPPPPPAPTTPPPRPQRPSGLRERDVWIPGNVAWTDTNINVRSGQGIYFEASGEIRWGPGRKDGPDGERNSPTNPGRPMPRRAGAALIGRVGENSTDYFFIGSNRDVIRMRSSGRLFLGINDDGLQDNRDAFRVLIYY
jgi:hypothetical protein